MSASSWSSKSLREGRRSQSAFPTNRVPLARLLRLLLLLQSGGSPNARELAESCEISPRTVYRDLELLAGAGVPLIYSHERQGYQLSRGFFLQPTKLEEREVLALLVLSRQWSDQEALGLQKHAREGALKLVHALSAEARARVLASVEPFQDRCDRFESLVARRLIEETLISALSSQRQVRLWYSVPATQTLLSTKFSLYRVLLHDSRWYLVGRSSVRRRIEIVRLERVRRIELTEDRASPPPRFNLEKFLAFSWGLERDPVRYQVWLKFSPRVGPEVTGRIWHRSQTIVEADDGHIDFHAWVDGLDAITRWILGFGEEVEVLAPRELRESIHAIASKVASKHAEVASDREECE
jgi:predicted DNA-binding transcriptional regulator YafY